jgi:hypothetical protein
LPPEEPQLGHQNLTEESNKYILQLNKLLLTVVVETTNCLTRGMSPNPITVPTGPLPISVQNVNDE